MERLIRVIERERQIYIHVVLHMFIYFRPGVKLIQRKRNKTVYVK